VEDPPGEIIMADADDAIQETGRCFLGNDDRLCLPRLLIGKIDRDELTEAVGFGKKPSINAELGQIKQEV
jgi:hypothetical protein